MVNFADAAVGNVTEAFKRKGMYEDMVVVFSSECVPTRAVVVTRVAEAGCVCACWAAMAGRSVSEDWHIDIPCGVLTQQQSDSRRVALADGNGSAGANK